MESNKQETRSRERTLFYPQPSSTCKTCPLGKLPGFQIGTLDTTATARESGRPTENLAMPQKSGVLKLKNPVLGFNLHQSDDSWNDSSINFTHLDHVFGGVALYEIGLLSKVELFVAQLLFRQIPDRTLMAPGQLFNLPSAPALSSRSSSVCSGMVRTLCIRPSDVRPCNVVICNSIIMELSSSFPGKSKTCLGESLQSAAVEAGTIPSAVTVTEKLGPFRRSLTIKDLYYRVSPEGFNIVVLLNVYSYFF